MIYFSFKNMREILFQIHKEYLISFKILHSYFKISHIHYLKENSISALHFSGWGLIKAYLGEDHVFNNFFKKKY